MRQKRLTPKSVQIDLEPGDALALTLGAILVQVEVIGDAPSLLTVEVKPQAGQEQACKVLGAMAPNTIRVSGVNLPKESD